MTSPEHRLTAIARQLLSTAEPIFTSLDIADQTLQNNKSIVVQIASLKDSGILLFQEISSLFPMTIKSALSTSPKALPSEDNPISNLDTKPEPEYSQINKSTIKKLLQFISWIRDCLEVIHLPSSWNQNQNQQIINSANDKYQPKKSELIPGPQNQILIKLQLALSDLQTLSSNTTQQNAQIPFEVPTPTKKNDYPSVLKSNSDQGSYSNSVLTATTTTGLPLHNNSNHNTTDLKKILASHSDSSSNAKQNPNPYLNSSISLNSRLNSGTSIETQHKNKPIVPSAALPDEPSKPTTKSLFGKDHIFMIKTIKQMVDTSNTFITSIEKHISVKTNSITKTNSSSNAILNPKTNTKINDSMQPKTENGPEADTTDEIKVGLEQLNANSSEESNSTPHLIPELSRFKQSCEKLSLVINQSPTPVKVNKDNNGNDYCDYDYSYTYGYDEKGICLLVQEAIETFVKLSKRILQQNILQSADKDTLTCYKNLVQITRSLGSYLS